MEPWITLIVFTALVIGGVWGTVIIAALMKRQGLKLAAHQDDPRIEELQEDYRALEARFEQLEEEVSFFRELHEPESRPQLGSPDSGAS